MSPPRKPKKPKEERPEGITRITVKGFKSLANETSVEIRPLTILAGANSSGKSSIMQPLLMMKQTLEAPYDPGPLLLGGPNVRFSSPKQLLARCASTLCREFAVEVSIAEAPSVTHSIRFRFGRDRSAEDFQIRDVAFGSGGSRILLRPTMSDQEVSRRVVRVLRRRDPFVAQVFAPLASHFSAITRSRCFLVPAFGFDGTSEVVSNDLGLYTALEKCVTHVIHAPAIRGQPARDYPRTGTGPQFPGTFEPYTASLLDAWRERASDEFPGVAQDLRRMSLTSRVTTRRHDDARIEVLVGRPPVEAKGRLDLVSIADVGFGVSQVLPVVVALHAAEPGRFVYIEQPEIHLHPRAQIALASVLADAAKRGVRVVAETHSSLLLLAIQTLLAKGKITPEKVALHWFKRREDGVTDVTTAEVDETGAFGGWPEDFSNVELHAEDEYLSAVERFEETA